MSRRKALAFSIKTLWNLVVLFSSLTCVILFIEYRHLQHRGRSERSSPDDDDDDADDEIESLATNGPVHVAVGDVKLTTSFATSLLIKSVLLHTEAPVHLHLIADRFGLPVLRTVLETWAVPRLTWHFYPAENPNVEFALSASFLRSLPQRVDKLAIFDSNVMVNVDPSEMWSMFRAVGRSRVFGMIDPWSASDHRHRVVFLDVSRLRRVRWTWETATVGLHAFCFLTEALPCRWEFLFNRSVNALRCNGKIVLFHGDPSLPPACEPCRRLATLDGFSLRTGVTQTPPPFLQSRVLNCHRVLEYASRMPRRAHPFYRPYDVDRVARDPVTLVTQLSIDRFDRLAELVNAWPGPVSAAIYATDAQAYDIHEKVLASSAFHRRKNVALHVVFGSDDLDLYPVNYLRNIAMNHTHTEHVLIVDVDFLPGADTYDRIVRHLRTPRAGANVAYVVIAFETSLRNLTSVASKTDLLSLWHRKLVTPFLYLNDMYWFHIPSNYSHWKAADSPYEVRWHEYYEPYVVVKKTEAPSFDERFVGYHWNKVIFFHEMKAAGFRLIVLPDAFVVHMPHAPSAASLLLDWKKCMDRLFERVKREVYIKSRYKQLLVNQES